MSPSLYVPVGIPGCGKSTFAEKVLSSAHVISTDKIRAALGDVADQSKNDLVFERFHATIRDYLELSLPDALVYADATNLTRSAREILRGIAADTKSPVHLIIFDNGAEAVRRNAKRERVVPEAAMIRMLDNYERFRMELPREAHLYDTITEIRSFG